MKKLIAGLVAGLILGSASVAGATTSWTYWVRGGSSYTCTGIDSGVLCKERSWSGLYGVSITKDYVGITRRGHALSGCKRGYEDAATACFEGY